MLSNSSIDSSLRHVKLLLELANKVMLFKMSSFPLMPFIHQLVFEISEFSFHVNYKLSSFRRNLALTTLSPRIAYFVDLSLHIAKFVFLLVLFRLESNYSLS